MSAAEISVLVADDHPLVRSGIRTLLNRLAGVKVIAETGDGLEALRLIGVEQPDIALVDIEMPGLDGIALAQRITAEFPDVRVIILSMYQSAAYIFQALQAGVAGYLVKGASITELEFAIRSVFAGEKYFTQGTTGKISGSESRVPSVDTLLQRLTPRQTETLRLIAEGHGTKEIAHRLQISVKTVEAHRAELMERLNIFHIAGLVRFAIQAGLTRLH